MPIESIELKSADPDIGPPEIYIGYVDYVFMGKSIPGAKRYYYQPRFIKDIDQQKNADFAIGIVYETYMMPNTAGISDNPNKEKRRQSVVLGFKSLEKSSRFVLSHEFGHMISGLGEGYEGENIGSTVEDDGWCFTKQDNIYYDCGPRINIYNYDEVIDEFRDYPSPEDVPIDQSIDQRLIMGERYINVMGLLYKSHTWIDEDTYEQILDDLKNKGVIGGKEWKNKTRKTNLKKRKEL